MSMRPLQRVSQNKALYCEPTDASGFKPNYCGDFSVTRWVSKIQERKAVINQTLIEVVLNVPKSHFFVCTYAQYIYTSTPP